MAMPEIDEVKDAALKYDKKALAKMVQMGQMSSTTAMMAAMMRDRIVQSEMKPPAPPTVADEVFQPAQGLAAVPTDPRMFQGMAGGGIVAMAGGGDVQRFQGMSGSFVEAARKLEPYVAPGSFPNTRYGLRKLATMFPTTGQFFGVDEESLYIDPVTKKPVTLKEYMQLQDQRSAAERTSGGLSAIAPVQPTGSDTGMPSPSGGRSQGDGLRAMTPDQIRQAEMLTDPTGGLTNKRMQDEAARAEALKAAGEKPAPAPEKEKSAAGPARVAAPAPSGTPDFFTIADRIKSQVTLAASEDEKKTYADVNQEMRDELTKAGYDFNLIKDQIAERRKDVEKLEGSKKEAANMRLLEAGLAILGGESPYAFVNIGKGASKAMQGFQDDIKEIAKNRRELDKDLRQLETLGNNEALMMTTEGRKRYDAIQKRVEDRKRDETKLQYDVAREVFKAENDKYLTGVNLESRERTARIQANAPGEKERLINRAQAGDKDARKLLNSMYKKENTYTYEEAAKQVDIRLKSPEGMSLLSNIRSTAKKENRPVPSTDEIRQALILRELQNAQQVGGLNREGFSATEVK